MTADIHDFAAFPSQVGWAEESPESMVESGFLPTATVQDEAAGCDGLKPSFLSAVVGGFSESWEGPSLAESLSKEYRDGGKGSPLATSPSSAPATRQPGWVTANVPRRMDPAAVAMTAESSASEPSRSYEVRCFRCLSSSTV